jgi:hypothetical protein
MISLNKSCDRTYIFLLFLFLEQWFIFVWAWLFTAIMSSKSFPSAFASFRFLWNCRWSFKVICGDLGEIFIFFIYRLYLPRTRLIIFFSVKVDFLTWIVYLVSELVFVVLIIFVISLIFVVLIVIYVFKVIFLSRMLSTGVILVAINLMSFIFWTLISCCLSSLLLFN